ncbi:MAG: glycosyltransferase family 4 protein [Methanobrevibacter sp.]|nr:glycosyltransferase family 4 protein [Methanobrevibacter sp.]
MIELDILILFLITFFTTVFFTYFARKLLIDANIADNPIVSEHRHKSGTPTMGGIALLISMLFLASIYFKNFYILITSLLFVTAGIVGLLDDLLGLKVKEMQKLIKNITTKPLAIGQLVLSPGEEARAATEKAKREVDNLISDKKLKLVAEVPIKNEISETKKIIAQIVIGVFLVVTGSVTTLGGFTLGLLAIPIVIIGIVGALNAINLIDGMDGLASGIIFISSLFCGIFLYINGNFEAIFPFAILSSLTLGFLVFNKFPASIFMGDTGSFALGAGYATAVLITDIPYFGVLALAVPILSAIVSLMHRAKIIRLPTEPLHHTLHHNGLSEQKIVFSYCLLTAVVCVIGILIDYYVFL